MMATLTHSGHEYAQGIIRWGSCRVVGEGGNFLL